MTSFIILFFPYLPESLWSMTIISFLHIFSSINTLVIFSWRRTNFGKSSSLSILCLNPSVSTGLEKIRPRWLLFFKVMDTNVKITRCPYMDSRLYSSLSTWSLCSESIILYSYSSLSTNIQEPLSSPHSFLIT